MGTFSRPLTSNPGDRIARLQTMMDMPLPMMENLGQQFQQGALDSFGLGTALREGNIPQGNTQPAMPGIIPNPLDRVASLAQQAGAVLRGDEAEPSMSEEEYRSSPSFREDIPFEAGMTASRAEALAFFYDQKRVREFYGEKAPVTSFVGQFFGQALDPINYVPVFGPAAEAAAVARLGTIAGRALISSGDAAINTAAFALMSSGLREQFGDDVGWEATVNEIAMSALIGGAFGGVMGGISQIALRRANASDQRIINEATDRLSTLQALKESRAVLNEAVADLTNGVPVNLSKNSGDILARVSNQSFEVSRGLRDLTEASAAVPENAPRVAVTPSGLRVEYQPEVVELDSLVAATGPLQVRNRNSQASAAQVEQIATALDPARLMPSAEADTGAPIVGDDGVIDSGNGRVMAIRRAAEAYPDRYSAYRKAIEAAGYSTEGMSRPVLISRRTTPLSPQARAKFNAEANAPRAAQMSAVELAAMDRDAMVGALDILDQSPVTSASNRPFVQRFIGNLTPSARGALVDPEGRLNADGVRRIENALVALAYGDVDMNVLRRFAEATDDNTRAVVGAMADAAPAWATMRQAVKRGDMDPQFDTTPGLTEALRMLGVWREQAAREKRPVAKVISEGMRQLDLVDGGVSPEAQAFIATFYTNTNFTKAAGRDSIGGWLTQLANVSMELGQPQLFGKAGITQVEMIQNVASNEQWNLFTPNGDEDGIGADGPGYTPNEAGRQGAGQGAEGSGRAAVARQEDGSLQGLPRKVGKFIASAFPAAQRVAAKYMADAGLPYNPPNTYAKVDPERARRIADAYDAMEHNPADPEVAAAYQAMADETLAQYQAMLDDGMVIEFIPPGAADPYDGNPRNMTEDVRNNNHMWVFPTVDGFGSNADFDPAGNPLLADSGFTFKGQPATVNDVFRAVHDYFGHVKEGVGFRADGEENAWRAHSAMYSPLARRAMTSETRGQNSWVNYGPYGEANRTAKSEDTHYADQKIGLLPEWVVTEGAGDEAPATALSPSEARPDAFSDFIADTPERSLDEVYAAAEAHQTRLAEVSSRLADETGAKFKNPGIKKKETSAEKMARKGYKSTRRLTDVVRGGFVVETPEQAARIVDGLGREFTILDEQWRMTEAGYFDRKVLVKFDDGTVGEIQLWHPELLAKKRIGHKLYEEMRSTDDPARKEALLMEQRNLYVSSLDVVDDDWLPVVAQMLDGLDDELSSLATAGRPALGNALSKLSSESGNPLSTTSANSTGSQPPSSSSMAQARPSDVTAGRPSQSMNRMAGVSFDGVPMGIRNPDAPEAPVAETAQLSMLPNEQADAEGRVGKDEGLDDMARAHGVNPRSGGFMEQADIEEIRNEGRLTGADEAELAAADQTYAQSEAYGRALDAAIACVIRG